MSYPCRIGDKVVITRPQLFLIGSTSDCWICQTLWENAEIYKSADKTAQLYYYSYDWLENEGFIEHLEQLIGQIKEGEKSEKIIFS